MSSAIASGLAIPPEEFNTVIQSISTNSVTDAPIATESEFPVLILSHGFGGLPELNTIKAEELASQGYIVIGINHTYDSIVNAFPNGEVVPQSSIFGGFSGAEDNSELLAQSIDIRAEDARFVLDELEEIDATGLFNGKLDLERAGIYGYSLGGATAAKVLEEDSRFLAGINLDGGLFGDVADASLSQPFMFFNNEAFGTDNSSVADDRELEQIQQSFVNNLQNEGYEVTVEGTVHENFNDVSFLFPLLENSGIELGDLEVLLTPENSNNEDFEPIDPDLAAQIINDYTTAFFDRYLNGEPSPLLDDELSPYPEVIFQAYAPTDAEFEAQSRVDLALEQTDKDLGSSDIGVSVGVVTPDGTWTGATGVSDLETGQATQPDDLFNIGSISKSYTSAVILKLQERGKLSLDDTLGQWLPEIAAEIPDGDNLTIRQLLNGTGGLYDYVNNEEFAADVIANYQSGSNRDWQPEDLIAYAFSKPLFSGANSTEQWTYTNTGNVIAALIAEKAIGKPFKEILAEEILEPLGLKNTFFTTEEVNIEERARGYDDIFTADGNLGQDGVLEDYTFLDTDWAYGDGSIVASSEDVARFFQALASGELLSPESTAEIFNYVNTGFERDDSEFPLEQFGLGVFPRDYPWSETRSMNGGLPGYTSDVDYFLDDDLTISVLVNQGQRSGLVRKAYTASVANAMGLDDDSAINGTEANDTLTGKEGLDALDGGAGNDRIEGNLDDDILFGKEGNDLLYGGEDNDFINGGADSDRLYGNTGNDSLVGGEGHDTLNGGVGSDVIDGGTGNDELTDTEGSNSLYGNDGDDLLFAGMEDDALYGDAGQDLLQSGAGNDQLFGGVGDDELNGEDGDDNLIGGEGNDTIAGLSGADTLTGNAGSDRFILSTEGTDIITDFTMGEDLLELPENASFSDLKIVRGQEDNANNTFINFESETLAVLNNIDAANISQSDLV